MKKQQKTRCEKNRTDYSIIYKEVPVVIDGEVLENCTQLMFA